MQQVFQNTSKVYVDSRNANNLLYLPLDKLIQQVGAGSTAALSAAGGGNAPAATNSVAQAPAGSSPPMEPDPRPRTDPRENLRNRERP